MKKVLIFVFAVCGLAHGQSLTRYQNWCEYGGQQVVLQGISSDTKVQASYPQCQVDVFLAGTVNHANIFSDLLSTPLANPFIAGTNSYFGFYAANTCYDVTLSTGLGPVMPAPITFNNVCLGGASAGSGTVLSFAADCTAVSTLLGCNVATPSTTPVLTVVLATFGAHKFFGNSTGSTTTPGPSSIGVGDLPVTLSGNTTAVMTVGTLSGTGSPLCTDANANATTAGCPVAAVSSVFGRTGVVVATSGDYSVGQVTGAAPLASPTFTGVPLAPTAGLSDNTTQIATTAFVKGQGYLTVAVTSVFTRSGAVTAQTGDYTVGQVTGAAPLASPTFTGVPAAPTPSLGDNSTTLATTAYVQGQGYLSSPPGTMTRVQDCGTTGTCAASILTTPQIVKGTVALGTGAATVTGISPAFTSAATFSCVTEDVTDATKTSNAVPATASSINLVGTGADVISYQCVGN